MRRVGDVRLAGIGVALFGVPHEDGSQDLYLNPPAALLADTLLKQNGGLPCSTPINEGGVALIVGHQGDERLLSS